MRPTDIAALPIQSPHEVVNLKLKAVTENVLPDKQFGSRP
jgi:hypothetical protein